MSRKWLQSLAPLNQKRTGPAADHLHRPGHCSAPPWPTSSVSRLRLQGSSRLHWCQGLLRTIGIPKVFPLHHRSPLTDSSSRILIMSFSLSSSRSVWFQIGHQHALHSGLIQILFNKTRVLPNEGNWYEDGLFQLESPFSTSVLKPKMQFSGSAQE